MCEPNDEPQMPVLETFVAASIWMGLILGGIGVCVAISSAAYVVFKAFTS